MASFSTTSWDAAWGEEDCGGAALAAARVPVTCLQCKRCAFRVVKVRKPLNHTAPPPFAFQPLPPHPQENGPSFIEQEPERKIKCGVWTKFIIPGKFADLVLKSNMSFRVILMALLLYLAVGDPSDPHLTLPLYVKVRRGSASIFFVPGAFQIRSPSILLKTKLSEPFQSLSF